MKIYISCDLEGVAGIVDTDQVIPNEKGYDISRRLLTNEVNAAIEGAFEAGAKEVLVNDSHGYMNNILLEQLDPRASVVTGRLKPLMMVQGIEKGFDAAFFVGYHAKMGSGAGVLEHTYIAGSVSQISINGKIMGEFGINALICGYFKTPVILVSGDKAVCNEARKLIKNIQTVCVKEPVSRYSARSLHPKDAERKIKEGAKKAIKRIKTINPFKLKKPYELKVKFLHSGFCDAAQILPGAIRLNGLTLGYKCDDILTLIKGLFSFLRLAQFAGRK
jgi:D-amino peptidase